MIRTHRCGGRVVTEYETNLVTIGLCTKCREHLLQRKRQSRYKPVPMYETFRFTGLDYSYKTELRKLASDFLEPILLLQDFKGEFQVNKNRRVIVLFQLLEEGQADDPTYDKANASAALESLIADKDWKAIDELLKRGYGSWKGL